MLAERLQGIRPRLDALAKADPSFSVFGSHEHRYRLNDPLGEDEVRAFERRHGIELPKDYRGFLIRVGNGGAGPCYGLLRLGDFEDKEVASLSAPFPHAAHWNPWDAADPPYPDEAGRREFQAAYFAPERIQGSLPVCHEGCGYFDLLVVVGPERGNMWIDGRVSDAGISPLPTGGEDRITFIEWYCRWLDEASAEVRGEGPSS